MDTLFEANVQDGIVVARLIHYFRNPEINLYGVSDRDIYEKGFLNFNHHPDQKGVGPIYSNFNARGTKVAGLPVRLMESWEKATLEIENGELFPASSMKSENEGHHDGAILVARFSLEQLLKMGFGINTPFDMSEKKPYVKLSPEEKEGKIYLKIKSEESLDEIDAGLKTRFDLSGHLLGSSGEFYIPQMLPVEEYRDCSLVFRPDDNGNGFHTKYWMKDIHFEPTTKFSQKKLLILSNQPG